MAYELRMSHMGDEPIDRHRWISYALNTPALVRWDNVPRPERPADEPTGIPVFRFRSQGPSPRLFWRDGEIVILDADESWMPEVVSMARQLGCNYRRVGISVPLYTLEGWQGERGHGSRFGQSFGVAHWQDEEWVEVVSHEPTDRFDEFIKGGSSLFNTLSAAIGLVPADSEEGLAFRDQRDRLRREGAEVVEWTTAVIGVDSQRTDFAVHEPVRDTWCAVACLPEVHLSIESRSVPLANVSLVRLAGVTTEAEWEDLS